MGLLVFWQVFFWGGEGSVFWSSFVSSSYIACLTLLGFPYPFWTTLGTCSLFSYIPVHVFNSLLWHNFDSRNHDSPTLGTNMFFFSIFRTILRGSIWVSDLVRFKYKYWRKIIVLTFEKQRKHYGFDRRLSSSTEVMRRHCCSFHQL